MLIRINLILFAVLTAFTGAYGQAKYEPQILILAPNEVTYDKTLEEQVATYNDQIGKGRKAGFTSMLTDDTSGQPENIKIMVRNEMAFSQTSDFSKLATMVAGQYLSYVFFEKFPNLLVIVKDIKCSGKTADLKKIAEGEQMQYVLNFPKINFYKEAGISKAKVSVQLYDQYTHLLLLQRDFTGDWRNPGFVFNCPDSTLLCTINNALAAALEEVIGIVADDSPLLQNENLLFQERYDALMKNYYTQPYDSVFINKIISPADTHINSRALYQGLTDNTKTKFVAFYLEMNRSKAFNSLKDGNEDIKIISGKNIKDTGFLDDIPETYAYIVKGVKYNGNWYYKKSDITYFEADDIEMARKGFFSHLQEWNFFKEGTVEYNPDFWETHQFEKIKNLKKDPDWKKYKEMWETEERENRDYVGMYKVVADELKKRRKDEYNQFDSLTGSTVFLPFYEAQMKSNPAHFARYNLWGKKPTLIFPKHMRYALNPIAISDSAGRKTLHFYFAFAGSDAVYEWTYLQPVPIRHYSGEIIDQLGKVTKWNFTFTTLDDDRFWENYVLAKSGNEYKYLKRVQ